MSCDLRALLIAINTCADLRRESICRLAADLARWSDAGAASTELAHTLAVSRAQLERALVVRDSATTTAARETGRARALGIHILTRLDPDYPADLFDLALPPPVLYRRGVVPQQPGVSIVGSRRADPYGRAVTELFAGTLARCGLVVVSGLARGIDSYAHRSALQQAGGRSIAVLGCGLDLHYPRTSGPLQQQLSLQGAVLSEFPLSSPPLALNFPIRNRIIAALAAACLVVQAAPRSGSLITARLALELGRELYAVPGRIFDRLSKGTNALIRDGAFPVEHPRDILDTLPLRIKRTLSPAAAETTEPLPVGAAGRLLAALVPGETRSTEELEAMLHQPIESLQALLLELELEGWIRRHPGAVFSRTKRGD